MRVIDWDSHFHEPADWLERADPALAAEFPPSLADTDAAIREVGLAMSYQYIPAELRPVDPLDVFPPGFRRHLELTFEMQPDHYSSDSSDPVYDAGERIRLCDEQDIDVQFLNTTYGCSSGSRYVMGATRIGRPELIQRLKSTWNTWAADSLLGRVDRLIPVTQVDLSDIDWTVTEMTRMRGRGSRAINLDRARVPLRKSLSHPDFDPIWAAAEDLGMAVFAHASFDWSLPVEPAWEGNGRGPETSSMLNILASSLGPQMLLGSFVLDGVLARHPRLVVMVQELGHQWLPQIMGSLDSAVRSPQMFGTSYKWELSPSEYLRRQVRVALLPMVGRPAPDDNDKMWVFSTDFPHLEGSADGVSLLNDQFGPDEGEEKNQFFGAPDIASILDL